MADTNKIVKGISFTAKDVNINISYKPKLVSKDITYDDKTINRDMSIAHPYVLVDSVMDSTLDFALS